MTPGLAAFRLSFQLSPIILTGGITSAVPGGMLPIISLTEALNFTTGLLSGGDNVDLDSFFANFQPLPGSTLIDQQIGKYSFANQQVAANAVIAEPLVISLRMIIPVRGEGAYAAKLATMLALRATLAQHNSMGGTYTVATPAGFYDNLVMRGLRDVSDPSSKQAQNAYQWDFEQPLLTQAQAAQAQNSAMSKISNGLPTDGSLSGINQTVGFPSSLATPSISPAASGPAGAGIAPPVIPVTVSPLAPLS